MRETAALQTINTAVQSALAYSEQLNKRKAEREAKKAELQGKPMPATLERELESIDAELARQAELIAQKKREVVVVTAKYDADKERWRELVAARRREAAKAATPRSGDCRTEAPAASAPQEVTSSGAAGTPRPRGRHGAARFRSALSDPAARGLR